MATKKPKIVRQPVSVDAQSRRRLDERLYARFPEGASFVIRAIWSLPSHSRLRRAVIRRAVRVGLEAANRGDFEAAFVLYDPQAELIPPANFRQLDRDSSYHGREERIRFQQRWATDWGDFDFLPEEVLDLGDDRLFVSGRVAGSGASSGAPIDSYWAVLLTLSAGRVIREQAFFDRDEALSAAGLS